MAFTSIAASETDANSPLNQSLMDKVRTNSAWLNNNTSPILLMFQGGSHKDKPDGGAETTYYSWLNGQTYLGYDQGSGSPGETIIINGKFMWIPVGCSTVRIYTKLKAEANNVSIGFTFKIGAASTLKTEIATTAGGTEYTVDVDVSGLEGTVQEFNLTTYNNGTGGLRFVQCYYIICTAYAA